MRTDDIIRILNGAGMDLSIDMDGALTIIAAGRPASLMAFDDMQERLLLRECPDNEIIRADERQEKVWAAVADDIRHYWDYGTWKENE